MMALILIAFSLLFSTGSAWAGSATSTLNVSTTVTDTCRLNVGSLNFGTISPLTGGGGQGTITSTCTSGQSYKLKLDQGYNATDFTHRYMGGTADNTSSLQYNLYTDSAHTQIWGDGSTASAPYVQKSGSGGAQITTVYGLVDANQNTIPADNYSDSVEVTLEY